MDWMSQYGITNQNQRGVPNPVQSYTPPANQPASAGPSGGGYAPNAPSNAPDNNAAWGNFGTYGNWAAQFAAEHGRAPNPLDERDYWDSQVYAANNRGVGPSWQEWNNRYWTGNFQGNNPWTGNTGKLPYRWVGAYNGTGGYNAWEPGFGAWSPRGQAVSPEYQSVVASQGMGPYHFPAQDWAAWYQNNWAPGQGGAPAPATGAAPSTWGAPGAIAPQFLGARTTPAPRTPNLPPVANPQTPPQSVTPEQLGLLNWNRNRGLTPQMGR